MVFLLCLFLLQCTLAPHIHLYFIFHFLKREPTWFIWLRYRPSVAYYKVFLLSEFSLQVFLRDYWVAYRWSQALISDSVVTMVKGSLSKYGTSFNCFPKSNSALGRHPQHPVLPVYKILIIVSWMLRNMDGMISSLYTDYYLPYWHYRFLSLRY